MFRQPRRRSILPCTWQLTAIVCSERLRKFYVYSVSMKESPNGLNAKQPPWICCLQADRGLPATFSQVTGVASIPDDRGLSSFFRVWIASCVGRSARRKYHQHSPVRNLRCKFKYLVQCAVRLGDGSFVDFSQLIASTSKRSRSDRTYNVHLATTKSGNTRRIRRR